MTKPNATYAVRLLKTGKNKIDVIRVIRDAAELSLAEAKELLDEPGVIQKGMTELDADSLVSQLDAVGAEAVVEGVRESIARGKAKLEKATPSTSDEIRDVVAKYKAQAITATHPIQLKEVHCEGLCCACHNPLTAAVCAACGNSQ